MTDIIACGYRENEMDILLDMISRKVQRRGADLRTNIEWNDNTRFDNLTCHIRVDCTVSSPYILKGNADLMISRDLVECMRHIDMLKYKGRIILTGDSSKWECSNRVNVSEIREYVNKQGYRVYEVMKSGV